MTNPVSLIIMALPESAVGMSVASKANIDAWFERIGFAGSIAPSLETLSQLIQLHVAAIPFENLDPLMGVPIRLDLANLQQKLLFDRRGGYCLEQNLLFKAMLQELDFEVSAYGARVLLGVAEGEERPLTHLVLVASVAGVPYLVDAGFGSLTPTVPLRLRADVEQATAYETYRLTGGDPVWQLEANDGGDWIPVYAFEPVAIADADITAMNDLAADDQRMRTMLMASRADRTRRVTISNLALNTRSADGNNEARALTSVAELRDALAGQFGIALPNDERLDPALQKIVAGGTT